MRGNGPRYSVVASGFGAVFAVLALWAGLIALYVYGLWQAFSAHVLIGCCFIFPPLAILQALFSFVDYSIAAELVAFLRANGAKL